MRHNMIFPRDPDTLWVIKEVEKVLSLNHMNISELNDWELEDYINKITFIFRKKVVS